MFLVPRPSYGQVIQFLQPDKAVGAVRRRCKARLPTSVKLQSCHGYGQGKGNTVELP